MMILRKCRANYEELTSLINKIGNCVYIGLNSTLLGGIKVGDEVLIAPNTFVNQDVPSHSIVIGNPCKIIPRKNAADKYLYNKI